MQRKLGESARAGHSSSRLVWSRARRDGPGCMVVVVIIGVMWMKMWDVDEEMGCGWTRKEGK